MNEGEGSLSCFSETTTTYTNFTKPIYNISPEADSPENDDVSLSVVLYNLSTIQDKVHQIQSLLSFFMMSTNNNNQSSGSTTLTVANIEGLVQEIITAASSMMFTCQQLHISSNKNNDVDNVHTIDAMVMEFSPQEIDPDQDFMRESTTNLLGAQERGQISFSDKNLNCYDYVTPNPKKEHNHSNLRSENYEILELDVAELLAKYTHYCHICGKGFKRDANLRMHMRAHGDEYKTREALIGPTSHTKKGEHSLKKHYYSCPQQGCRWNQRHENFQPLKSVICAKNHYKRSHCPKMYMCRRCSVKYFSVLSDLRTHEKHCGDIKWVCSCGTKFSRKDKLMSHVSLFVGHSPAHGLSQLMPSPMITRVKS